MIWDSNNNTNDRRWCRPFLEISGCIGYFVAVRHSFIYVLLSVGALGCAAAPVNPSFPVTTAQAQGAIRQMRADPRRLDRPLVLIGGYLNPGIAPIYDDLFFQGVSNRSVIIPVSLGGCESFAACRKHIIAAVDAACPSADPNWTSEVDVVGVSLGGLAARYAAAPSADPAHPRRLRISRLFSISSPHSGSKLAQEAGFTQFHLEMRPGSQFLRELAASDAQASYRIYPYTLLGDDIVGEMYAAPPGMTPYWLASDAGLSHPNAMADERILADIARRLRDEPPFSHEPPAPLPVGR